MRSGSLPPSAQIASTGLINRAALVSYAARLEQTTIGSTSAASARPSSAQRPASIVVQLTSLLLSKRLLWFVVVLGIVVRIRQYIGNRSLWLDESFLALNIISRSVKGLLDVPLDFNQAGPAGFLVAEKFATELFGKGEFALRAFPLFWGILSVPLFALVALRLLEPLGAVAAVALFSLAGPLIYFSSEVKPYSGDVAAIVALLLIGLTALNRPLSLRRALALGILGFLVMQFTYAGVLAAAGIGAALVALLALDRRSDRVASTIVLVGTWAVGAIVFLATYVASDRAYYSRGGAFAPLPSSPADVSWYFRRVAYVATDANLYRTLSDPLVIVSLLAAVLGVVGTVALAARNWRSFALVVAPVLATVAASGVHRYPLLSRTMVFFVPLAFLLIAAGSVALANKLPAALRGLAIVCVLAVLLAHAAFAGIYNPIHRVEPWAIKESLSYVGQHWREGDVLYVHYPSQYAFAYYLECECLTIDGNRKPRSLWPARRAVVPDPSKQFPRALIPQSRNVIIGVAPAQPLLEYGREASAIEQHPRGWVLITFYGSVEELKQVAQGLLAPLGRKGKLRVSKSEDGGRLYLYDFGAR